MGRFANNQRSTISIHALLAESDNTDYASCNITLLFLSTLSLRRATAPWFAWLASHAYFYPRSPCGERHKLHINRPTKTIISIHALLAESDFKHLENRAQDLAFLSTLSLRRATLFSSVYLGYMKNFYPRSPCGERHHLLRYPYQGQQFLSTLSLRRATPATRRRNQYNVFLSTLSLRRATRNGKAV